MRIVTKFGLTVTGLTNLELIEEVQQADKNFRDLIAQARGKWEQSFAGKDASDACASVSINPVGDATRRQPVRGSGFVKSTRKTQKRTKIGLPHFAR